MNDNNFGMLWKIACVIAALYLAWTREWVAAGIFALAAK